jgi:hypothetical protein
MRFSLSCSLVLLMATAAGNAFAQKGGDHNRFKWRDGAGNLHYSDALPPEAAKLGYEVVSPQGIVVKRVERAKTRAELADAKVAAAKAKVEHDQQIALERADEQLLTGYPEERDLTRAQAQQLEMLKQQVVAAEISLRSQEQMLADLLGRAAETERGGKSLPPFQARQLAQARQQVDEQRLTVKRRQDERDSASERFEQETVRYRELKARLATANEQPH